MIYFIDDLPIEYDYIFIYHSYVAYVALAEGLLAFGTATICPNGFTTKGRVGPKRAAMGRLTQWDLSGSIAFFFFAPTIQFLGRQSF